MDEPSCPSKSLAERFQKTPPVRIVLKDCLPPVPMIEHMINGRLEFALASEDGGIRVVKDRVPLNGATKMMRRLRVSRRTQ